MALTLLPQEVLEQVIEHLSLRDLLACSAVSLAWREKFNVDRFWKKFCIKEIGNYLEDAQCNMQPGFILPQQNEERLHPLCSWRINYMRNVHLLNNWKSGRFSLQEFRTCAGVISSDVKIDCDGIHWLFIRTETEIEVWNINTVPQLYASIPIFLNCPNVNILISGKKIIITQWNIVSIYNLECHREHFKTDFSFVLEEDKIIPTNITDNDCINKEDYFQFTNFGDVLVGYNQTQDPQYYLSMHLWCINTGKKLRIESVFNLLCDKSEIAFSNIFKIDEIKGLIRLVFRSAEKVLSSQLNIYDFKKEKLTNTNITTAGVVVWCGCAHNIIITFNPHPGTIKFYNYLSGKQLSVKEIGEYANSEEMQLIDSYLLYCMFNCMHVLDIHKQENVYCLEFSFPSYVRILTVIEPRFIVVRLLESGVCPGIPSYYQEVWDIKDLRRKLFQFSKKLGFEIVGNSFSIIKQIISYDNMIHLCTFW